MEIINFVLNVHVFRTMLTFRARTFQYNAACAHIFRLVCSWFDGKLATKDKLSANCLSSHDINHV